MKTEVDELDIDKLVPVPNDLAKLSYVANNEVVKKTEYNTLKAKVDNIDTDDYVLKTKYDSEIGNLKLKIPDVSGLVQSSTLNRKLTELEGKITTAEGKIPDIINLVNKTQLTAVENKIPDVTNLVNKTELKTVQDKIPDVNGFVKKADYAAEITKIKSEVTTTALDARHKDLVQKTTFNAEIKKVDDKVVKNTSDILSYESRLKQKEDVTNDLERDASFLRGFLVIVDNKII